MSLTIQQFISLYPKLLYHDGLGNLAVYTVVETVAQSTRSGFGLLFNDDQHEVAPDLSSAVTFDNWYKNHIHGLARILDQMTRKDLTSFGANAKSSQPLTPWCHSPLIAFITYNGSSVSARHIPLITTKTDRFAEVTFQWASSQNQYFGLSETGNLVFNMAKASTRISWPTAEHFWGDPRDMANFLGFGWVVNDEDSINSVHASAILPTFVPAIAYLNEERTEVQQFALPRLIVSTTAFPDADNSVIDSYETSKNLGHYVPSGIPADRMLDGTSRTIPYGNSNFYLVVYQYSLGIAASPGEVGGPRNEWTFSVVCIPNRDAKSIQASNALVTSLQGLPLIDVRGRHAVLKSVLGEFCLPCKLTDRD